MKKDWSLYLKDTANTLRYHAAIRQYIASDLARLVGRLDGEDDRVVIPPEADYRIRYKTIPIRLFDDEGKSGSSFRPMDDIGDGDNRLTYGESVGVEDIADLLLRQLELPELHHRRAAAVPMRDMAFSAVRPAGILPLLDKRQTLLAAIRRRAQSPQSSPHIRKEDLRFHALTEDTSNTHALLVAVMDVSASMQAFERRIARIFFYWTRRFLNLKYPDVEIHYVVHHTQAFEVNEPEFFTVEDDGGTVLSQAYRKVQDILAHFGGADTNVYVLHFTDGDNRPTDREGAKSAAWEVGARAHLFGYVEIGQNPEPSPMLEWLGKAGPPFRAAAVHAATDLYPALRHVFSRRGRAAKAGS